jgi:hypothetical protein
MAALDRVKEELAYLKFWLGIVVVTAISLAGWLISSFDSAKPLAIGLATGELLLLTLVIMYLHRRIEGEIKVVGTL